MKNKVLLVTVSVTLTAALVLFITSLTNCFSPIKYSSSDDSSLITVTDTKIGEKSAEEINNKISEVIKNQTLQKSESASAKQITTVKENSGNAAIISICSYFYDGDLNTEVENEVWIIFNNDKSFSVYVN